MKHHLCIEDEYVTFDGKVIPIGKILIEKEVTKVLHDLIDMIVADIGKEDVVVCGRGDARRMLGRKLEDRLKRKVMYE